MERDYLRDVDIDGFRLRTWESDKPDHRKNGQNYIGYEFFDRNGTVLFTGEDFGHSPMDAIDSDETLRCLLGFLTLRPGDTDSEYFENYTPEQMSFAETEAEYLSVWAMEPNPEYPEQVFMDA
jgi:hypothetical protein